MNEELYQRQYRHVIKAYYAKSVLENERYEDEVSFGLYAKNGCGGLGEASVRWYRINGVLSPKLEIYGDSWFLLALFADLIYGLAHSEEEDIQPDQFCQVLERYGFVDVTERTKE